MSRSQRHANGGGKGNSEVAKVRATLPTHLVSIPGLVVHVLFTLPRAHRCLGRISPRVTTDRYISLQRRNLSLSSRKARVPNSACFSTPPLSFFSHSFLARFFRRIQAARAASRGLCLPSTLHLAPGRVAGSSFVAIPEESSFGQR